MAKIKIGDVEDQARLILLDTYGDAYRFEPKEIYVAMNEAFKRIRWDRPESRYVNGLLADINWTINSTYDSDAIASTRNTMVDMEDRWTAAAVYYTVHKMYLKDDPDTANAQLADRYLAMYKEEVAP